MSKLKKVLTTLKPYVTIFKSSRYGSLVKRLRRRPLTAETGVRFPYELLIFYMIMRPVGQAVKTPPSHGGNRGSIPLQAAESLQM